MANDHKLQRGYIQVYTGEGKGKTTAALGQALRAVGHDLRVFMILFMKGNIEYGELETARRLAPYLELHEMGRETFVSREDPAQEDIQWAQKGLCMAKEIIAQGQHDMLILDELNVALDYKLLTLDDVLDLMETKPAHMELIMTGRGAHPEVIKRADLVSEVKMIKHYYDQGVDARVGIER